MTVADCKPGDVIEIIDRKFDEPVASGRIYKLGKRLLNGKQTRATYDYSQNVAILANCLECRLVEIV